MAPPFVTLIFSLTDCYICLVQLKRTLIVIGTNIFLQLTGQNFSSVYGTIFIKSIGTVNPFAMNSINVSVNIVMVLITQMLTDRTGRV